MRKLTTMYVAITIALAVVSVFLWRELRTDQRALQVERLVSEELRTKLADAQANRTANVPVQLPAEVKPELAKNVIPTVKPAAPIPEAMAHRKTLYDDPAYYKARFAEVSSKLKGLNPTLADELGISEKSAERVVDILAEAQLSKEALKLKLAATGSVSDAAVVAETRRLQELQQLEHKNTLTSILGPAGFEQLQFIEQTQAARNRVINLRTLLAQSGQTLSSAQLLSLTKVMANEQTRAENESRDLRASGQTTQVSQLDRAAEGDRRILAGASGFLNTQQIETIRARFEQRAAMERASGVVQTRERQVE